MVKALGFRQVQPILRARQRNERKSSFLFHTLDTAGFTRREHAFGKRAYEYVLEFKTFRRMNRHQPNVIRRVVKRISIRKQRRVLKVVLKRNLLTTRRLKLVNRLLKFRKVVKTLLATFRAQHFLVTANT